MGSLAGCHVAPSGSLVLRQENERFAVWWELYCPARAGF
eukprot:COSAG05_NODE_573_length_8601_cov_58.330981_3_plen_39_part_00